MSNKQVFVVNSGDMTAEPANPNAGAGGVLHFFPIGATALDITADTLTAQPVYLALKRDNRVQVSNLIEPEYIEGVYKKAYRAPVSQVTTVSGFSVPTQDGSVTIRLVDYSIGSQIFHPVSVSVPVLEDDAANTIAAAVRAAIAANPRMSEIVTVSGTAGNVVLTANSPGVSFATIVDDLGIGANIVATTAPDVGSGHYEDVLALEESVKHDEVGDYYVNDGILGRPGDIPTYADPTKNYTLYTIRVRNKGAERGLNTPFLYTDFVIAVATSGVTGSLDDFLGL